MSQQPLDTDAAGGVPIAHVPYWRTFALEISLIFMGGIVGTGIRSVLLLGIGPRLNNTVGDWPLDLLIVNGSGALLIGLLAGWRDATSRTHDLVWLTVAIGFLGAYTTFSSLALDLAVWERQGRLLLAGLYLGGSIVLGLLAVEVGLEMGAWVRTWQSSRQMGQSPSVPSTDSQYCSDD